MRRAAPTFAALLAAVALLAGCGISDPYAQPPAAALAHSPARVSPAGAPAREKGARGVLARYTALWVNWSAGMLSADRRALLGFATGPLAGELRREQQEATRNQLQQVSGAYNHGRLVGVIEQVGGQLVVLTFEQAAPLGGQPQDAYEVYIARVIRTAHGWRVSEWQPASEG